MGRRRSWVGAFSKAALLGVVAAMAWFPPSASAQQGYVVQPVVEKRLKELPTGPLFWRVERFGTLGQAQAAESRSSLAAEVAGQAWLFSLGPQSTVSSSATDVVEIGPLPPVSAPEYLLRINFASGPPGATTAVHTHPGSESFYVLTGQLGQKMSHGEMRVGAGQTLVGHGPGMPMEVSSSGASDLTALVLFVVDATQPFSSPATFR